MAPLSWQLTIDADDPHALADFWAAALGAELEDNSALIENVLAQGWAQESDTLLHHDRRYWRDLVAVRGAGPRILLQRVPEAKAMKNRLHLDLNVGEENLRAEVDRLVALGAVEGREWLEAGGHWIAMTDPEGNEFDVQ
ncbi:MAG: VOC family protein [Friedmanniella sp.]